MRKRKGRNIELGVTGIDFSEISGFRVGVFEIFDLACRSAAWVGLAPTSHLQGSIRPRKDVLSLEVGPICCH